MFGSRRRGTVIAEGLKIVGTVTAEGLVEVNGQIEGELHCTSLIISRKAHVANASLGLRTHGSPAPARSDLVLFSVRQ